MHISVSKSASNRLTGKHQVDEQRASILDAAEKLFLENGLENTRMIDIAAQAQVTKVTLYRYFANRDEIAVQIQARMLGKINNLVGQADHEHTLEGHRELVRAVIRNFPRLRDAYCYIGMFDKIYLDHPSDQALTRWTKDQLLHLGGGPEEAERNARSGSDPVVVIMNTVTWFLEKLALRGELTWSNQDVPLEEHLKIFEDMVMGYFDRLIEKESGNA
jgi:AcrR family transcriptional regulator